MSTETETNEAVETEQDLFELARVPADIVDALLQAGLPCEPDEDWHDLVAGGRQDDGSLVAHPSVVAELGRLTGIDIPIELVPPLSVDEMVMAAAVKGMVTRFKRADFFDNEEQRAKVIDSMRGMLGRALTDRAFLEELTESK